MFIDPVYSHIMISNVVANIERLRFEKKLVEGCKKHTETKRERDTKSNYKKFV